MLSNMSDFNKLKSSIIRYIDKDNVQLSNLIQKSCVSTETLGFTGWHDETLVYEIVFSIPVDLYKHSKGYIDYYEKELFTLVEMFINQDCDEELAHVRIRPIMKEYINWAALKGTQENLYSTIEEIKAIMVKVATGGEKIQNCNEEYIQLYLSLDENFQNLGITNPNIYKSLWEWYGRWSQSDLGTYRSRRQFISEIYKETIETLKNSAKETDAVNEPYSPTGWERVDRTIYEMRSRLAVAINEEQFQAIGMLGRETLITIAQEVYDSNIHKSFDDVSPSETDAKRMLDAYISYTLQGGSHERQRKFAKASVDLANHLTHDRMATKKDAEICLLSVSTVSSLIKNLEKE